MKSIDIFPWNENFNTGVAIIDEQHRKLVQLLNLLASHVAFKSDIPELNVIFDELAAYAVYHFRTEESVWHAYLSEDELETGHKQIHQSFVDTVLKLRNQESHKTAEQTIEEILAFLTRWLATHILENDRYLAAVVLAMQSGMPLASAKQHASAAMGGSTRVLIEIILSIYENLSTNTLHLMREIAKHKRDEDILRKLTIAMEQIPISVVITNLDADIEYVNSAFINITGFERAEVIGRNPRLLQSGKTPRATYHALWAALRRGETWKGEFINKRRDGLEYPELALISPVQQADGTVTNYLAIMEDITDRKVAEIKLRKANKLFDTIIDNIPHMIFLKSAPDLRFELLNRTGEELLGHNRADMLGRSDYDFFSKQEADFFTGKDREVLRQRHLLDIPEETIQTPFGVRILHTKKLPLFDEQGQATHLLGISEDITERKRLDEELRVNEQRLRGLYELSPLGIALVDMQGRFVDFNEAFRKITGYTAEELHRLDYWELTPQKYAAAEAEQLESLAKTGRYGPYEKEYRHKSGRLTPLQLTGMLVRGVDGMNYIWSIVEDIGDRKQAENQLRSASQYARSLIETSLDPLVTISADGKIMDVNQATENVTGRPRQALIGSDFSDYFTEPDKARDGYRQVFSQGFVTDYPLAIRHVSGAITEVLYNASVYRDEDGRVQGVFASARDVTEQKRAQLATSQAKELAERMAKIRSEFLANMSHEIRTPMNGILGLSQLALNQPASPEIRDYLEKIASSSQSLLGILNDILDFSKIEAGRMSIENSDFDLDLMLDNLSNLFEERAKAKQLAFKIELAPDTPRNLIGDAMRLQQIISNLLGNAIKFTSQGSVSLKIGATQIVNSRACLSFSVQDTGIGIARRELGKLFQPFSQVDGAITRRFGGTGLGLAISHKLLQLMGGDFRVDSQPGQGSAFSFDLWLGIAADAGVRQTSRKPLLEAGKLEQVLKEKAHALTGANILLAEDNAINQQVVKEFLKLSGINAIVANNGQEAIDLLARQDFDAILMDVHMPVMDGVEATRRVRARTRYANLPIIALTAGVTREERDSCLASGMNDFISKPVNPENLIDLLVKWINPEPAAPAAGDEWSAIVQALPEFDFGTLEIMIGGRADLLLGMLRSFHADFAAEAANICADLHQGELTAAERKLHCLKGAAGSLGAQALHQASEALDARLKLGGYDAKTLNTWREVFDTTMAALAKITNKWR